MFQQKTTYLFYCFFFVLQQAFGQNSNLDSLQNILKSLSAKSVDYQEKKAEVLYQILIAESKSAPMDSLLKQADALTKLCKSLGDTPRLMEVDLEKRAIIYSDNGKFIEALFLYKKYVEYLSSVGRDKENGYLYIDIGNVYLNLRLYKSANNYYKKAEAIFKQQGNKDGLVTTYTCFSFVARHLKDSDTSAKYARLAFELTVEKEQSDYNIAYQRFVLGRALEQNKKYQEAKEQFEQALTVFLDTINLDPSQAIYTVLELVRANTELKSYDSVAYYMQFAKDLFAKYNIKSQVLTMHLHYTEIVALTYQKKYQQAIKIAEEVLKVFPSLPPNEMANQYKRNTLLAIGRTYAEAGDSSKMYEFAYKAEQINKILKKNTEQDELIEVNNIILQMENEQTIAAQQNAILEKEKKAGQERFVRWVLLGIILIIVLGLIIISVLAWQLKKKNVLIKNYADDLEKSDQNKALLLSVIGHDLRAPFNTIFKGLQLASLKEMGVDSKKYLDQIAVASRGAFVMLDNLMQWIGVQKENFEIRTAIISLNELLNEILRPIEVLALDNQISIQQDLKIEKLEIDKDCLQIILRNLIFNAIKHSLAQGTIYIKTYIENEQVHLSIDNDGGQISDTVLDELKSLQSNKELAKRGSGLGLILVQEMAAKLGIRLSIENKKDGGVLCTLIFDKEIVYEHSTNRLNKENAEKATIDFSKEEQDYIRNISAKLKNYDIFETTEIKKILEEDKTVETKNILIWKKELVQAAYLMNEELYRKLIDSQKFE